MATLFIKTLGALALVATLTLGYSFNVNSTMGFNPNAQAAQPQVKLKTQVMVYKDGNQALEGYLAYDENIKGKRPGVLVVHDWVGLGHYAKRRANELAALGYVAFAADIYGKGVRPKPPKEAGEVAGRFKANRPLMRSRAKAGFDVLRQQALTDPNKTAAIGYCFGGTTILELARSGAPLKGFISFHGGLDAPNHEEGKNIKGRVLVLHGADDPFVPAKEVAAFKAEMEKGKVNWQFIAYPGAVHAFTNPDAGNNPKQGAAYNAEADQKSWAEMKRFFGEIFK